MLDRTAGAAEKMDGIYRHQRFIYDLTRRYYLLGRDGLIVDLSPPDYGAVLEIGCGTGRNLIQAAHRYPTVHLSGIDVSATMLTTAARNVARAGLRERIWLAPADACAFDPMSLFDVQAFDRIFISYTLSMIADWPAVLAGAARHLTPSGSLHIVDFGDFTRCPRAFAAAMRFWLKRFHVTPIVDFEPALASCAASLGLELRFARPFRGYVAYAVLRRPVPSDMSHIVQPMVGRHMPVMPR